MKDTAYLIIHGFAGYLDDIDYLAEYLRKKGLDVHTTVLPGHSDTKKALRQSTHMCWINHVRDTINALKTEYHQIVYIGFSMGGLIGVQCADIPEIQKFVFLNTPIYFWNIKIIAKDIVSGIRTRQFDRWNHYKKGVLRVPIKSSIEFLKILSESKKQIGNITKPTLVIQCKADESVRYKSAQYIKDQIPDWAILRYYPGGCHQILAIPGALREEICGDVYEFLMG